MIRPIKLDAQDDNVFMVSDMHIRHDRDFIYGPRKFGSVTEHDETLILRWNQTVAPNAHVFHIGDIIFNDPTGENLWNLLKRLTFKVIYLMPGNHFSGWMPLYKSVLKDIHPDAVINGAIQFEIYPASIDMGDKTIVFLPNYVEVEINHSIFVLCHYPIICHYRQGRGSYHICGHTHGNLKITHKDTGSGRRLDVGIESFGRPVSVSEIKKHLDGRDLDILDHHDGKSM